MDDRSGFFLIWYEWGDICAGSRPVVDRLYVGVISHYVHLESPEPGEDAWFGCTVDHEKVSKNTAQQINEHLFGIHGVTWVMGLVAYDLEERVVRWQRHDLSIGEMAWLTTIRSCGACDVFLVASSVRPDEQKLEIETGEVLSLHATESELKFRELVEADGHCEAFTRIRLGFGWGVGRCT